MTDPVLHRKLDALLAGQARADEQHAAVMARLGAIEEVQRQVLQAITGLREPLGALRESIDLLVDAATAEPKQKGKDIADILAGILHTLKEQHVLIGRATTATEALPDLMERIALRAFEMAQGGGVEPPKPS